MAENGSKLLEVIKIAGNGWKWLEWLEMAGTGWKCLEMSGLAGNENVFWFFPVSLVSSCFFMVIVSFFLVFLEIS